MDNKKNNKLETEQQSSIWNNLYNEWKLYITLFLKPLIVIPVFLFLLSFYYANAADITDKRLSLILNAFAAVALAVAGGFLYDAFKCLTGDTILIKKGLSAVRNLSLARHKTKNIVGRTKQGATSEEIKNLLTLLEKDIANSTQEWNDILPGVVRIEEAYALLAEKENELEITQNEKEQLEKQQEREKELGESEKERLRKDIEKKDKEVLRLSQEISKLQLTADTSASGVATISGETIPYYHGLSKFIVPLKICSKCGKSYLQNEFNTESLLENICQDCSSKG
ncbi:MAG: hypothetical protein WA240_09320 [Nitrospirota bacterium]|jgi:hypothetical protein